jgi:hypothetical protein
VLHQQRVERDPVPRVDRAGEGPLGLLGGPRPHDAEPVRDPVHVRVDRDRRDPVTEHEHAVRRLRTHPLQRRQRVVGARDLAAEPLEEVAGDGPDHPGLGVVEPGPPDERLDRRGGRVREGGRVRILREQERARDVGRLVARALGEDGADQHLERVLGVVAEVGGPPIARPIERRQSVEQSLPVELGSGHGSAPGFGEGRARAAEGGEGTSGGVMPGSERSGSSLDPDGRFSSPIR